MNNCNAKSMFITDLDGTLFNDDRQISPADWESLTALGKAGVVRVVATGRSIYSFQKAMDHLGISGPETPLPVDYVIFSTGAGIMAFPGGKILRKVTISRQDIDEIIQHFNRMKMDYMVHAPVPHTREFLYHSHGGQNHDFNARIKLYQAFGRPLNRTSLIDFKSATQVLAIVPPGGGEAAARHSKQALPRFSVIRATSPLDGRSTWIEVFSPQVSKSRATAWLADQLGIHQKDTIAVGNDYNDLDLLEWSGRALVVDNAPAAVMDRFEVVAGNNRSGVSRAARFML